MKERNRPSREKSIGDFEPPDSHNVSFCPAPPAGLRQIASLSPTRHTNATAFPSGKNRGSDPSSSNKVTSPPSTSTFQSFWDRVLVSGCSKITCLPFGESVGWAYFVTGIPAATGLPARSSQTSSCWYTAELNASTPVFETEKSP